MTRNKKRSVRNLKRFAAHLADDIVMRRSHVDRVSVPYFRSLIHEMRSRGSESNYTWSGRHRLPAHEAELTIYEGQDWEVQICWSLERKPQEYRFALIRARARAKQCLKTT